MPKLPDHHKPFVYQAIDRFVTCAFSSFDSMFTPGQAIWTEANLRELHKRFVLNPDESTASFIDKFQKQLDGARPTIIQLAGELLFTHLLVPYSMRSDTKMQLVNRVLSWSPNPVQIPPDLLHAFDRGMVNDQSLMMHRPFHLWYIIELLLKWHTLPPEQRQRTLSDPWEFKKFTGSVETRACQPMREILLFFVHRDAFEPITSRKHKRHIVEVFGDRVKDLPADVDQSLLAIRTVLSAEFGAGFHYYEKRMFPLWNKKAETPAPKHVQPNGKILDDDSSDDEPPPSEALSDLADIMLLDLRFLEDVVALLSEKRQVIFYGPPGTGKTWVAQQLAEHLAESSRAVRIVQFHPSYTYEDFVEGYRPTLTPSGQPGFKLMDGPLKTLAREAAANPDERFILLIDEINRGNLAKVFGELYFLLEYRGRSVRLQYSDEEFSLPENLWLIGTMNTADRSIALIDAALRRRFFFVGFFPDRWPVEGLLRRWLIRSQPEFAWVADLVDLANRDLNNSHMAIGPSHFMKTGLSNARVERIWQHAILPYLEEQFFGEADRVSEFTMDRLRARLTGGAAPENADAAPNAG